MKDIAFRHNSQDNWVFSRVNIDIKAGECLAIVGVSGAGKSTLLKCLSGLYPVQTGAINHDGVSVYNNSTFRGLSAAVFQDDALLSGSILDNIAGFSEQPDIDKAISTAQMACIHNDILAMPMQYQTLVGDMGSALSGGQLQRLLLARALYQDPQILFLDEASSHLDIGNEATINSHLKTLLITRIIVAHRPQTIALADRVLCLHNGILQPATNDDATQLTDSKGD